MTDGAITRIPVDNPLVFAFRITGDISAEDMADMASVMNAAFDAHPSVSMLLIFDHFDGARPSLDMKTLRSQFRALAKVDKYAVVGAPAVAATMITLMDKVIPTDARTFEAQDEAEAWRFVGARPLMGHP